LTLLPSNRALLDAFRRGDDRAVERVYYAYVKQVAALLSKGFWFMSGGNPVRFTGFTNAWDLECAVQDTFVQAFAPSARQAYDGINPYGPYLMTIAKNRVISQLRSDWRELRRRTALAAEPKPLSGELEDPEEQSMREERRSIVEAFRSTCTPLQLRFLDHRYRDELSLLETARRLGMTRMKARTLEQKIRRQLLRYLRKRGLLRGAVGSGGPSLWTLTLIGGLG
jgi:RNA polymerase sigma-70 factor (ECF subfamily)